MFQTSLFSPGTPLTPVPTIRHPTHSQAQHDFDFEFKLAKALVMSIGDSPANGAGGRVWLCQQPLPRGAEGVVRDIRSLCCCPRMCGPHRPGLAHKRVTPTNTFFAIGGPSLHRWLCVTSLPSMAMVIWSQTHGCAHSSCCLQSARLGQQKCPKGY